MNRPSFENFIVVKLAVGTHCCHCSLLTVVNFTASSDCWQLKSHCQQSLLATASNEQSLLLLPTVTSVCVRACVLKYTCTIGHASFLHVCRFVTFLHKTLFPLEGKSGHSLLLLPTVTAVYPCVCACACMHAY